MLFAGSHDRGAAASNVLFSVGAAPVKGGARS
jgi:hypothetical protein